jgi:hypothetical protein
MSGCCQFKQHHFILFLKVRQTFTLHTVATFHCYKQVFEQRKSRGTEKMLRYEEANADYLKAGPRAPQPIYEIICLFGKVDLK